MNDVTVYISFSEGHRFAFIASSFRFQYTIRDRLIQRGDRTGLKIVIDYIIKTLVVSSVDRTVPPVEDNIVYEVKVSVHTHRTVTTDIGSEKITAEHTIMSSDSGAKRMIISIQCFREHRILNGNVHSRQLQSVPGFIPVVDVAIDRHIFIQSPACRTVVYYNIADCISSYCIITESNILCPPTETHMANHYIMSIDQERMPGHADTVSRCCLSGNRYIRGTYTDRAFQANNT